MPKATAVSAKKKKKTTLVVKGERKQPKRKTVPLFLTLPDEKASSPDARVWLATANLETIQVAARLKKPPTASGRRTFYTVTSPTERLKALDLASKAIQLAEERVLPTYGGRQWTCHVTIKDNPNAWYVFDAKGRLQPATLAHLLPYNTIEKKSWNGKKSATASLRGCAALVPPKFPKFHDERATMYAHDDDDDDETHDELAHLSSANSVPDYGDWYRISDWILHDGCQMNALSNLAWTTDTETRRLTVSMKWISPLGMTFRTRTTVHAEALQLCRRQVTLDRVLVGVTPTGKLLPVNKPVGKRQALTAGKWRFERDGLWVVGQEDEWRVERMLEQQQQSTATGANGAASMEGDAGTLKMSPLAYYMHCNRKSHQAMRLRELAVQVERQAVIAAAAAAAASEAASGASDATIAAGPDNELDVDGAPDDDAPAEPSAAMDQEEYKTDEARTKEARGTLPNSGDADDVKTAAPVRVSFTLRDAERELRIKWKELSTEEQDEWARRAKGVASEPAVAKTENASGAASQTGNDQEKLAGSADSIAGTANNGIPIEQTLGQGKFDERINSVSPTSCNDAPVATDALSTPASVDVADGKIAAANVSPSPIPVEANEPSEDAWSMFRLPPEIAKQVDRASYRLNKEQISLCYDAGMEHYDQIMRTVQLRDLHRELQDGFDLFRERGRGRYDMELPVFDESQFNFLTDIKKAPWMPVVREILGKNVMLIHKGMFLSMPGAVPQPYHQDGIHLTRQYQKPCHAINVFVPLIDMTMQHGPTEFCLGSHILGKDDLDRNFCVTPLVPAGTPVIFDYRLGHRGLGNSASTCRPIVYCTYACAADGKEFRDSVNFSRKRYRKIGDIVEKAPSRDERAKKRRLQFDDVDDGCQAVDTVKETN